MLYNSLVVDYFNQLHHSAIFMRQDVAMVNKFTSEVREASSHLEVSRSDLACCGILLRDWYGKRIPPGPRSGKDKGLSHCGRIEKFNNLEGINMDMERVPDVSR